MDDALWFLRSLQHVPWGPLCALHKLQWAWATTAGGTATSQAHQIIKYFQIIISAPQTDPMDFALSGPFYRCDKYGSEGVKGLVQVLPAIKWQSY